jgi:hypothetical protein
MKSLYAASGIILLLVLASNAHAENWKKFFTNAAGYDFFYDKDSIIHPTKSTVQVWYKVEPTDEVENKAFLQWLELREVDCTRRRYKTLQGRASFKGKPMEILTESTWTYLEPGALYDAFYKTVCGQ